MKMESLQQRREELERKEFQLKESLLKFDKFLKVPKPRNRLTKQSYSYCVLAAGKRHEAGPCG